MISDADREKIRDSIERRFRLRDLREERTRLRGEEPIDAPTPLADLSESVGPDPCPENTEIRKFAAWLSITNEAAVAHVEVYRTLVSEGVDQR